MSSSGSLGISDGQADPDLVAAHARRRAATDVLASTDRAVAVHLGMVRVALEDADADQAGGTEPALVLDTLKGRLEALVRDGEQHLDPVVRQAGYSVAEHRTQALAIRAANGQD